LKEAIRQYLDSEKIEYKDFGTFDQNSVDYPPIAAQAAHFVADGKAELGILCCGTGIGMSIAANKIKGIRAANCNDCFSATMARAHNNANMLTLGQRVLGSELAKMIVKIFLATPFEGERHQRRLAKIAALEEEFGR
jgi:ribose 5-phosphate isomerase B